MTKIQIKSEKLTPFGGIFSIMEQFDSMLSPVIDSTLGRRCSSIIGYQYSEIVRSLLAAALLLTGCKSKTKETQQTDTIVSQQIEKGDLLFVGLPMNYLEDDMSSAIASATGNGDTNFIHTAIFDVDEQGKIWIIDATIKHGVDRYPLDTFLVDFTLPDGSYPYF